MVHVILAPISFGELIDKITILQIKLGRSNDQKKSDNVSRELGLLIAIRADHVTTQQIDDIEDELRRVNESLWVSEDQIRRCESQQNFGPEFVALARGIYTVNDRRACLKRHLNDLSHSSIIEEKLYGVSS